MMRKNLNGPADLDKMPSFLGFTHIFISKMCLKVTYFDLHCMGSTISTIGL